MTDDLVDPERLCRQLLAQLELISHAPAVNWDPNVSHGKADGGGRPSGGLNHKDDTELQIKSHVFYRRRYNRCHTDHQFEMLAGEMRDALDAWKRTPPPAGGALEPEKGSFAFKRMIADSELPMDLLRRRFNLSERTVYRYRAEYRTRRAA